MADVTFIGEAEFHSAASDPTVCTPVTAAAGDFLVVIVHLRTGAVANSTTVTDSAGNTYTQQASNVTTGVNSRILLFTASVTSSLVGGSVTMNTNSNYANTVHISRWGNVAGVDAVNGGQSAASTSPPAVTVTTTDPGDVVVGGISYGNATAPSAVGGGFTALTGNSPNTGYYGAQAYRIPGTAGTYAPAWTTPNAGSASVTVALKPGVPTAPELLTNGSFETDANADGLADGWLDEHNTPVAPAYSIVTSGVHEGTKAQRIQYSGQAGDNGTKKLEIYQTTPFGSAVPGQMATLSLWVSGSLVNTYAFIGIEGFDAAHTYLSETDQLFTPTGTPQLVTVRYLLPAGTDYLAVYLQSPEQAPSSVVDLVIDDASLSMSQVLSQSSALIVGGVVTRHAAAALGQGSSLAASGAATPVAVGTAALSQGSVLTAAATVTARPRRIVRPDTGEIAPAAHVTVVRPRVYA